MAAKLTASGHPGAGKTVLAASSVEELREGHGDEELESSNVLYFFFHDESSTIPSAYRAMLSQLVQQNRNSSAILDKLMFPFIYYAAMFWIPHLCEFVQQQDENSVELDAAKELSAVLQSFLGKARVVMAWIEAFYASRYEFGLAQIFGLGKSTFSVTERSPNLALSELLGEMKEFMEFLEIIHSDWSRILSENPARIWTEVAGFVRTRFIHNSGLKVQNLTPALQASDELSSTPLCHTSQTLDNGTAVAILRIYPSR